MILEKEYTIKEFMGYLFLTDWYATRFAETGEAIPDDIKTKRQEARDKISELREEINSD